RFVALAFFVLPRRRGERLVFDNLALRQEVRMTGKLDRQVEAAYSPSIFQPASIGAELPAFVDEFGLEFRLKIHFPTRSSCARNHWRSCSLSSGSAISSIH